MSFIETTPITITFTEAPRLTTSSPVFKWSATTSMRFECSLDGQQFTSCGEGLTGQWTGTNVKHGRHNFKVRGTDSKGNVVEAEVIGWLADTIPPVITFTNAPDKTNTSPLLTWQSSEQATFQCSLDNGPYVNCGSGVRGQWRSQRNLRAGEHTFSVRGTDLAGNTGRETSHTWIVGTFQSFLI